MGLYMYCIHLYVPSREEQTQPFLGYHLKPMLVKDSKAGIESRLWDPCWLHFSKDSFRNSPRILLGLQWNKCYFVEVVHQSAANKRYQVIHLERLLHHKLFFGAVIYSHTHGKRCGPQYNIEEFW